MKCVVAAYGENDVVVGVKAAITDGNKLIATRRWSAEEMDVDRATDEIMEFVEAHGLKEIMQVKELLPIEEFEGTLYRTMS